MTYDLFLSYNSHDRRAVEQLYRLLQAHGVRAYFDPERIAAGKIWIDALPEAIECSRAFAVFAGFADLGRIQRRELQFALLRSANEEAREGAFPIIPVLLDGGREETFSGFAALYSWVDLRGRDLGSPDSIAAFLPGVAPAQPPLERAPSCPFRGLKPFREQDEPLFFGREAFSDALFERLREQRWVAVVGPSGSGKSSVVRAGLLPRLRRQRSPEPTWEIASFSPGREPLRQLARAVSSWWTEESGSPADQAIEANKVAGELREPRSLAPFLELARSRLEGIDRLLLVVDQFEELFTLTADAAERALLVELLLDAVRHDQVRVVSTLRADFYGQTIALNRELSDLLSLGQVNLGPMRRAELVRSVTSPAQRVGISFQDGLVERIVDASLDQPGNLPLLELALEQLWAKSEGPSLTHDAYEAIGGVKGAVSTAADRVLHELPPDLKATARALLPRFVRVARASEEGSDTRQLVALADLSQSERSVVDRFASARLLVTGARLGEDAEDSGAQIAEVAHESLIRDWETLRKWVEKDRSFLLWRQAIQVAMRHWQQSGRTSATTLRGPLLEQARSFLRSQSTSLSATELEYLRASRRALAGSTLFRYALTAAASVSSVAGIAGTFFVRSDAYAAMRALEYARPEDALRTRSSWDDDRTNVFRAWTRALVAAGRIAEVEKLWRSEDPQLSTCMLVEAAEKLTSLGLTEQSSGMIASATQTVNGELSQSSGPQLACAAVALEASGTDRPSISAALHERIQSELQRQVILEVVSNRGDGALTQSEWDQLRSLHTNQLLRTSARPPQLSPDDLSHEASRSIGSLAFSVLRLYALGESEPLLKFLREGEVKLWYSNDLLEFTRQAGTIAPHTTFQSFVDQTIERHRINPWERRMLRLETVAALAKRGFHEDAASLQKLISSESYEEGNEALTQIALAMIQVGQLGRAQDLIAPPGAMRHDDRFPSRVTQLALVGAALYAAGAERGAEYLDWAVRACDAISGDDQRSAVLSRVAESLVKVGRLREARTLADQATNSLDRLRAYAAIVESYYDRQR